MQLGIFSLVFASLSAPFALASPTPEGAVILGNLTVATELRVLPPNLRIQCRASAAENQRTSDVKPLRKEGFRYLDEPSRLCDIYRGHEGCGRVSCSWGAGIFVCAKDVDQNIEIMCSEVSQMARRIVETCATNDRVQGAIWDEEERFSVEIFNSYC